MKNTQPTARDWTPLEIRQELMRAFNGFGAQAAIARKLGVTPAAVSYTIEGRPSDRIRRAIAEALGKDVRVIWPSIYLYGSTPKIGRPQAKFPTQPKC